MMTLIVGLLILTAATQAQTLQKFFEKYADDERFQYVNINKGMINMGSMIGGVSKGNQKAFSKMNGLKILTLESETEFIRVVEQELLQVVTAGKFESAMEVREKGERVNIYYRVNSNESSDMLIITKEKGELTCIWMTGKMTKEEMMNSFSMNSGKGNEMSGIIIETSQT